MSVLIIGPPFLLRRHLGLEVPLAPGKQHRRSCEEQKLLVPVKRPASLIDRRVVTLFQTFVPRHHVR